MPARTFTKTTTTQGRRRRQQTQQTTATRGQRRRQQTQQTIMKQPIPPDSEHTIFTETEIQDRGIGEYLSSGKYEFLIRTGEKEEGDFLLLKNIINGMKVTLTFNKAIQGIPYSQLHERLQLL